MTKIYITRHGQDQDNANGILNGRRDKPLTDIGVRQAEDLANTMKTAGLAFDIVYTSPLQRARKTAEIICRALGLPAPTPLPELIERDFGVMSGCLANDIEKLCAPNLLKTGTITYFLSPEGAETFPQLLDRAHQVLASITSKHPNDCILLTTHGDMGKMLYAAYYQRDWQEVLSMFHFGNSELLLLAPDSRAEDTHVFKTEQFNH